MTEQWSVEGQRQAAYALLLSSFRQPKGWAELATELPWQQILGRPPEEAMQLFLDLGFLEYPDLDLPTRAKLRRLSTAELQKLLQDRNLRSWGRKSTLIARLLERDPQGMDQLARDLNPLQCTEAGRSIVDAYLATGGSMDGLDSPLAASSELAQSSAPFAWIADRLSHKTPADNAQVYDPEDMLPLADRAPASAAVQHLQQGHAYGYRGDLIQALLEFDLAIEANPNDPEAHLWRAVTLERLGDHRQALSDLRQAQDLNGAGSEILVEYGNVYSALSQWQLAIAQYDLALELSPQHVQAHHNRGVAYERLGQSTIARTCYEQAIALSPKTPEPHLGLAVACELMSDWAQAVASYQTVIETAGQGTLADQARERLQVLSNPA